MRWIAVCLLSFFALTLAAPSADASSSRRPEARAGKVVKPAQARASRPAAAPRQAASRSTARSAPRATARQTAARATPVNSRQQARNANRRTAKATAQRNTRSTATAARRGQASTRLTSWQAGLPAVAGEQRDCPAGTMSTLARGHDDIVRCMPL